MGAYRPPEEVKEWLARDPIIVFGKQLVERHGVRQEQLDEIAADVERELEEAAAFADASPHPSADEALEDVYAETYEGMALR
jgi:pyruvate dehydrogenase E1 component alpha subunit